jgi:hypothetical protein
MSSRHEQILRYTLYDKSGAVIETHVVAITNKELKARSGIVTLGTVEEDGYLTLERLNPAGEFTPDYSLNLHLEQTPADIGQTDNSPVLPRALHLPERAAIVASHLSGLIAPPGLPVTKLTIHAPATAPRPALAIRQNPVLRAAVIPQQVTPSKEALLRPLKIPSAPAGKSRAVRLPFIFPLAKNPEPGKDHPSEEEGDEEEDLAVTETPAVKATPDADDDDDDDDDDGDDEYDDEGQDDNEIVDDTTANPCSSTGITGDDLYSAFISTFNAAAMGITSTINFSTSLPGPGWSVNSSGQFVDPAGGTTYGYTPQPATTFDATDGSYSVSGSITIYISPGAIEAGANVLQSVIGHEAMHAANIDKYTTMSVLDPSQFTANTEYAAFTYQANVAQANYSNPTSQARGYAGYTAAAGDYPSGQAANWSAGAPTPKSLGVPCLTPGGGE